MKIHKTRFCRVHGYFKTIQKFIIMKWGIVMNLNMISRHNANLMDFI